MVKPITRPPRSCAPRLAASITPAYPPVQIVKPESASSSPTCNACEYSRSDSRHFEPPKIVTIRSCASLIRPLKEDLQISPTLTECRGSPYQIHSWASLLISSEFWVLSCGKNPTE